MVNPVPGYSVSTPYGIPGKYWTACSFHTGLDIAAPYGTPVVAARGGTVVHVNYGQALGYHQFTIRPGDGTEDFYAHTGTRPTNLTHVNTGQAVAVVSAEGNATGTHLHFERHTREGSWQCSTMTDPGPSIDYQDDTAGKEPAPEEDEVKPYAVQALKGWWLTDLATYRTGIHNYEVIDDGLDLEIYQLFNAGKPVSPVWEQLLLGLPETRAA